MSLLQAMTIACLLATGMGVALLGSVKLALARKLAIDEARVGGLVSMFGFAMIPTMLLIGFVTDLVGKQPVMIGGSVVTAVSIVLLARAKSYWPAVVGVLLLSASWSAQINVVNPVAIFAFPGSTAYAMNLACFFFGIGAFVTPLAVAFLLRRVGLTGAMLILAAFSLLTAALALGVDFSALVAAPSQEAAAAPAPMGIGTLLGDAVMWLCAFALFFFAPLEGTMGAWATTYLTDKRVGEGAAAGLLSGFWLVYTAARLVAAYTVPAGSETTVILTLSVVCLGVWVVAVWSPCRWLSIVTVLVAGAVFGPIYPTLMAVLLGHFDKALHGRAIGLLFTLGGLGWTLLPMLIGAYAQRKGVQRGFLLAAASALGLTIVAIILATQV